MRSQSTAAIALLICFAVSAALAAQQDGERPAAEQGPAARIQAATDTDHAAIDRGLNLVLDASWLRSVALANGMQAGQQRERLISQSNQLFLEADKWLAKYQKQEPAEPTWRSAYLYATTLRNFWTEDQRLDSQAITNLALMNAAVSTFVTGLHTPPRETFGDDQGKVLLANIGGKILNDVRITAQRSEGGRSTGAMLEQLREHAVAFAEACGTHIDNGAGRRE